MWASEVAALVKEIIQHPSVGMLAFFTAVSTLVGGYFWGSSTFASAIQVKQMKLEIVSEIDQRIIKRDIATLEIQIREETQKIELGICADPKCKWDKAQKQTLERRVQTLRENLRDAEQRQT